MLNKRNIMMISLFCLLLMIVIPFTVAQSVDDNQTITMDNQDEGVLSDNADYYFNSSAMDDGDGSLERPYKYLTSSRIKDNSTIHLASGEYELNRGCDVNQLNIIGEDASNTVIKYDFRAFRVYDYLSLSNVTLDNASILNYGSIDATNVVFCNGEGIKFTNSKNETISFGGAIYTQKSNPNSKVTLNNCIFKDNFATYGGAICMERGILEVYNTSFINNYAYSYGGAISCENCTNIIISKSKFIKNQAKDSSGGAIYIDYSKMLKSSDCTFNDNHALYGGAIWMREGDLEISNSDFTNNSAYNFGGAISAQDCGNVEIYSLEFVGNHAYEDAGGAIYVISSNDLTANNINISDSSAYYGAAITTLNTTSSINHLNACNNVAEYVGGAIYQMYCMLTLTNSNFLNNTALNGGALFIDNSTLSLTQNSFINNNALLYAGAIYSLFNSLVSDYSTNAFEGNHALFNDNVYETNELSFEIGNGDYLIFKLNETEITTLPSRYSMLEEGYLTPVKDQGDAGNCWAFTAMAVLESCIKKITGQDYDFSEENIKNLMEFFSDYGWNSKTNDGGTSAMAHAYFASWLGPVNDSDDVYSEYSVLSPIFNSLLHVQNILFLSRDSYTDNDAIKMAIMKYGAVGSSLFYHKYFLNNYSYYVNYKYNSDHAVTIVGWDDNYSKENFGITPEGDGAWIVKNSWGPDWGDNGYFYVSYYDRTLLELGEYKEGYTFILNDTIRFDKNYQYDIAGDTNNKFYSVSSIFYKNIFNATDNEVLKAVSTYFIEDTNWTVSINVNGALMTTKSGFSNPGYWTILLDDFVHLNKGDVFEVVFNIAIPQGDIGIPFSSTKYLNKPVIEGLSYISSNGRYWQNVTGVACIKAFTIVDDIKTQMDLNVSDSYNPVNITVRVVDDEGKLLKGNVTFNVNGNEIILELVNGQASIVDCFETGINNVSCLYNETDYVIAFKEISFEVFKRDTELTLDITRKVNNLFINITSKDNINDTVILFIGNDNVTLNLVNGFASYDLSDLDNGVYTFTASLKSLIWQASDTKTVEVNIKNTHILDNDLVINDEDFGNFTVALADEDNKLLSNKTIVIGNVAVKTNENGIASIPINWSRGKYSVDIVFEGDNDYFASNASAKIFVKTNIDAAIKVSTYLDNANVSIEFSKDYIGTVRLTDNGKSMDYDISNSKFDITLNNLSNGNHVLELDLLNDEYNFTQKITGFTINVIHTQIIAGDLIVNDEDFGNFTVVLTDEYGRGLSNKTIMIGEKSVMTDANGQASIPIDYPRGKYPIDITYAGDETYFKASASCTIFVKTNIDAAISVDKALNDVNISIEFSKSINEMIALTINDDTTNYNLVNGKFDISCKGLSNGFYTVSIDLLNDDYNFTKVTSDFTINVTKTQILADDFETTDFSGDNYSVKLIDEFNHPLANKQIKFSLDGKIISVYTDNQGIAAIPINLDADKYPITISYSNSSDCYAGFEITRTINVKTAVSVVFSHKLIQNRAIVNITFSKAINTTADLIVNNIQKQFDVTNGKLAISLKDLDNGLYEVRILLNEDEYVLSQTPYRFTVNVKQTKLVTFTQEVFYHSGGEFYVLLADEDNVSLANKKLNIVLGGKTSTLTTDGFGIVSMSTDDLAVGTYSALITFDGDDDYFATSNTATLAVVSSISLPQSKYTLNSQYIVTLYDKNGLMAQRDVNVTFNNVVYGLTTDNNGQIRINVDLRVGSYNVNVVNPETGEVKSQTIQVVARLSGNSDVVMYYGASKSYTVRVFDDYGQLAKAGEEVTFNVAGKPYKVKTDKNGYATYKITLKSGNYKITATYKGFTVSNKITVKPTLITKDKKAKKGKKIKYEAKLLNTNGKALKGKKITFKIKGKTYKGKTDKKGIAKITIKKGLKVGKYKITAKYGKLTSSSTITIKK